MSDPGMIERMARAIYARNNSGDFDDAYQAVRARCLNDARAALLVMREPTEAMVACLVGYEESYDEKTDGWRAAIDAALKE